jgi:hypothetical protein
MCSEMKVNYFYVQTIIFILNFQFNLQERFFFTKIMIVMVRFRRMFEQEVYLAEFFLFD